MSDRSPVMPVVVERGDDLAEGGRGLLLLTGIASAKRKSRAVVSTFNLRQISLALNMYLDDFGKRPPTVGELTTAGYLTESRSLLCPEDKTRDWGRLVESGAIASDARTGLPVAVGPPRFPLVHQEPQVGLPREDHGPLVGGEVGLAGGAGRLLIDLPVAPLKSKDDIELPVGRIGCPHDPLAAFYIH